MSSLRESLQKKIQFQEPRAEEKDTRGKSRDVDLGVEQLQETPAGVLAQIRAGMND
jgi:hypothetical protein